MDTDNTKREAEPPVMPNAAGSAAPACSAADKPTQNEFGCPHDCQYWYPEECARPEFTRCPIKYPSNASPATLFAV